MATIAIADVERTHGQIMVTWETIGNADQGSPYKPPPGYRLVSMQFTGTDGGGTFTIEGSNDETNFEDITHSTGSANIREPEMQVLTYRPASSGGTGTDIDAIALFIEGN